MSNSENMVENDFIPHQNPTKIKSWWGFIFCKKSWYNKEKKNIWVRVPLVYYIVIH